MNFNHLKFGISMVIVCQTNALNEALFYSNVNIDRIG